MKKLATIFAALLLTTVIWAQSPGKMSYQAVVRDASNNLATNQNLGMQISILQGSSTGTAVYVERLFPQTNDNGLVSIEIGTGAVVTGNFANIDWSNGPFFIKTETDLNGGATYTISGTSQLLSVPYALHASVADSVIGGGVAESDPIFNASAAFGITTTNINNWTTAYGWGNHASQGYLTSYTETDPVFNASAASGITSTNINNWTTAYGWGNHASQGYLTSYTETDPVFNASAASGITSTNINNWTTAYGWGNHATQGYLTSYTETDPIYNASAASGITSANITNWNNKQNPISAGKRIRIVGNTVSVKNDFYLGQDTLGGVVFYIYIDQNGDQRGLIVSKTETTAELQSTTSVTNSNRTWDGMYNTGLLINSPAKNWITSNFSADWYIPSIDELSILWHNRFHVNKTLNDIGATLLPNNNSDYWSSTEHESNQTLSFYFNMGDAEISANIRTAPRLVRAIRKF